MGKKAWLRSHVELLLQDIWSVPHVVTDDDGDYPYGGETSSCWVHLDARGNPWLVAVFAHAAYDVPKSGKLLTELAEIASQARAASLYYVRGGIVVRQTLIARTLDRESLRFAVDCVPLIADQVGQLITAVHGGRTPQPLEAVDHI